MTRPNPYLAWLAPLVLAAIAATAGCAWAGDRYGPNDYEYQSQGYSMRAGDLDAMDPCAVQYHLTGRLCRDEARGDLRRAPVYRQPMSRRLDEAETIDPCTDVYRITSRGCRAEPYGAAPREPVPYADLPRDDRAWRGRDYYRGDRVSIRDRNGDWADVVDACAIVHQRLGDRCPYEDARAGHGAPQQEEDLPDGFFIGDGGVGPGIADFGGGGGWDYAVGEGFSAGSASANAHASASVSVSVMASITANGHGGHYPPMHGVGWGGGKGGCGCKRGR